MAKRTVLTISFALFGLALGIASLSTWTRPAPAGQLPGFMSAHGLDAHGPFRFIVTVALLPLVAGLWSRALHRYFDDAPTAAWETACSSCLAALWLSLFADDVGFVLAPVVLFLPLAFYLRVHAVRFTSVDVALIPTLIVVYLGALDLIHLDGKILLIAAAWLLFVLRIFVKRGALFALAPAAALFEASVIFGRSRVLSVIALLVVFASPFALRSVSTARLKWLLRCVAYPIFAFALPLACSVWSAEGKLRVNFFEHGHNLQPASDIARHRAKLYRDTVPLHGMIEDALLDALSMKLRRPAIGNVLRTHELLSNLNGVAMYAVGTAASASPPAGILAFLFYRSIAAGDISSLRSAVALFALALMLKAVRRRSHRALAFAGAMTALAMLTSLDYGTYALVALMVTSAMLRSWRGAVGVATLAIPAALLLAIEGVFGDAIGRTLALLENTAAYNIGFVTLPQPVLATRYFPEVLLGFLDRTAFFYALWLVAVIFVAAIPMRRRTAPLFVVASFMIACGISYAERHHLYQQFAGVPFVFAGTALLLRMRDKTYGYLAAALLVIVAGITPQYAVMSMLRTHEGPLDDSVVALDGALFNKADAARVTKLRTFFAQNLGPTETFFDFTNRGLLYFLLDRRCPVPLNEVACYEPARAQREVIARLERSPEVRYALVPVSEMDTAIDGVPNATRAPLVWAYVRQHFAPAFNDGDVAVWKRTD